MGRSARVTSIDVLQTTAVAIARFRSEAASALDDFELTVRRVLGWIHQDRKDYWAHELRRSDEGVSQAKVQLQQARTARRVGDHEPECIDEVKALQRAKHRCETARRGVEAVRHWTNAIEKAVDQYHCDRVQFSTWLDGDMTKAIAALERMGASLESYTSLLAPASSGIAASEPEERDAGEGKAGQAPRV